MSESRNQDDESEALAKKQVHPIVWISLGLTIYLALQAWVFPKVPLPT